jgi:hypothetical protein
MTGVETKGVRIRATFERFPATVKGAFVMRGADGDPHQVRLKEARVVEASGADARPIEIVPATLDVAPNLDLFVPFEFPVVDLGPGWYGLECDVDVDGSPTVVQPGKRFALPWPRASVRRGQVSVGKALAPEGGPKVKVDHIECAGDSITVHYEASEPPDVRVFADGSKLEPLQAEFDGSSGRGQLIAYPLMKEHATLRIEVRADGKPRSNPAAVDITLP